MADDPYADIAEPLAAADPYAGIADPVRPRHGASGGWDEPGIDLNKTALGTDPLATGAAAVADAGKSMLAGLVQQGAGTLEGLGSVARQYGRQATNQPPVPGDTYMNAANASRNNPDSIINQNVQPATQQGQQVAQGIAAAMRYTGIPQVSEALGDTLKKTLGPEAEDALSSAFQIGTLRAPEFRLNPAKAPLTGVPQADAVATMRNSGYLVSPHVPTGPGGEVSGTLVDKTAASLAGNATVDSRLSVVNQDKTNFFAARQARLTTKYPTKAAVDAAITKSEVPYEVIKGIGLEVPLDSQYIQTVMDLSKGPEGFSATVPTAIRRLQNELLSPGRLAEDTAGVRKGPTTEGIVDKVRQLRSKGYKNVIGQDAATQDLGGMQLKAADALDDLMGRRVEQLSSYGRTAVEQHLLRKIYTDYLDARAWRSDLHVLEESMNPSTSQVSASKVAAIGERKTVKGAYGNIKQAFDTNPTAMQDVARASMGAQPDAAAAGASLGIQSLANAAGFGNLISRMLARYPARALAGKGVRQRQPTGLGKIARKAAYRAATLDQAAEDANGR